MPESGPSGSVRGALSNGRPYRDQAFRDRIVARLLPPESAAIEVVSREVGVSVGTLERWRAQALAAPGSTWTKRKLVIGSTLSTILQRSGFHSGPTQMQLDEDADFGNGLRQVLGYQPTARIVVDCGDALAVDQRNALRRRQ